MPILSLLLGSQLLNPVSIVYSARYYKEGDAKSSHQIFTCRYDGSHKKQWTTGAKSCLSPLWLDKKHIAYLEVNEFIYGQSYSEKLESTRFVSLDITTGKSVTLGKAAMLYPDPVADQKLMTITSGNEAWKLSLKSAVKLSKAAEEVDPLGKEVDDNELVSFNLPSATFDSGYHLSYKQDLDEVDVGNIVVSVIDPTGERSYKLRGSDIAAATEYDHQLYVTTKPRFTKMTCEHFVYVLGDTAKLLLSNVGWLTFNPGQKVWFATRPESREMAKLKNGKAVYISGLTAGNWQTGERWKIVDGLALFDSFQIQP